MTVRSFEDARGEVTLRADVVIVGSGPGGAAAARALAEGGARVIVLEEGPPVSRFKPSHLHTMRYHMQEGGGLVAMGTAPVSVAAGRGVGGGSLINSAICWRAPDDVLDGWTDVLGDDRFDAAHLGPVYDEIGGILGVTLTSEAIAGENNQLIVRGAQKLGLPGGLLHRNAPGCVGCGLCNNGCPSGGKASVDKNLLALARAAGAVVQADVKVDRVRVEGGRAVGVEGEVRHTDTGQPVGRLTVLAPRVLIAAGAVGTPRLLHHAGLADTLGPRLGKGLHLHPGNGIFGLCDHEVRMWSGATQGAWFADPALPGVLPHTMSLPPGALLLALGGAGLDVKKHLEMVPYLAGCLTMVSDKGEGTVSATADGNASMTYEFAPIDLQNMRAGLKRTCEVLMAGGARRLLVPVYGSGWVDTLDAAFAHIDRADLSDYQALYAAHPMATCRIGRDRETSVLTPDGQAHGLPGLYVADSSIFPTSLGVNPQWTTMTMATVIARGLLASAP
jgi:choline dehydrogenase-like flavoprotein